MQTTLILLQDVEDFAPGSFENTTVKEGCIQLGRAVRSYVPSGCYTTQVFSLPHFLSVIPSWNADTPAGTAVEMQVRLSAGSNWSRWFSFGKWSPFIDRCSFSPEADELAVSDYDLLRTVPGAPPADAVQMRIFLYSSDTARTPKVRLLGASIESLRVAVAEPVFCDRVFEVPAYACLVRDPSIAGRIAGPTTLCMMMNRWGQDVLPEEVARSMYDSCAGTYSNYAFLAAAGGMFGFSCFSAYTPLSVMKKELRQGNVVGARVRYRAPRITETPQDTVELLAPLELNPDATANSLGHFVVVRGFAEEKGVPVVYVNDTLTDKDAKVPKKWTLEQFEQFYAGVALFLRKGPPGAGQARPQRHVGELRFGPTGITLWHGRVQVPDPVQQQVVPGTTTACYTLSDGVAYASAAQKKFYYVKPDADGMFSMDLTAAIGKRITFYCIDAHGTTWVAEHTVPVKPPCPQVEPQAEEETQLLPELIQ